MIRSATVFSRCLLPVLAVGLVLAGCSTTRASESTGKVATNHTKSDGFAGTLVPGAPLRPADVVLTDTRGNPYSLDRPPSGKVVVLFFGFTHCDDICPTTMADLAAARRLLPKATAERVQVVFVTVDPRRDTPRALQTWLGRFDADFVGLRGPLALVHEAERSLYADQSAVQSSDNGHLHPDPKTPKSTTGAYQVGHSGSVYVFGPKGESLLYTGGTTATEYAHDFARLLS